MCEESTNEPNHKLNIQPQTEVSSEKSETMLRTPPRQRSSYVGGHDMRRWVLLSWGWAKREEGGDGCDCSSPCLLLNYVFVKHNNNNNNNDNNDNNKYNWTAAAATEQQQQQNGNMVWGSGKKALFISSIRWTSFLSGMQRSPQQSPRNLLHRRHVPKTTQGPTVVNTVALIKPSKP